ncbi:sodium-independent anion transporter, partial [Xanthomonas hortorum]
LLLIDTSESTIFHGLEMSRKPWAYQLQIGHSDDNGVRTYSVRGQVFFASADVFIDAFDARQVPGRTVLIDVSRAHFWDITAVAALDKVVQRLRHHGLEVQVTGLNASSRRLMQAHALGEDALESSLP